MNRFYPFIREELEKTGFPYYPQSDDLKFESGWMAGDLARELVFMLFDDFDYSFLRCSLSCSPRGYMFERSFFLGLPQSCDPKILFRILSDPHFAGDFPSLHIERSILHPEWNSYFYITLRAGNGFESNGWSVHSTALGDIAQTIQDSLSLYESAMVEGITTTDDLEAFLQVACRCFSSE